MSETEKPTEKPKIYINPPPQDKKCERCGKHISELKPYGKEGDPLVGSFDGALLVKTFRSMCEERIEEFEILLAEYKYDNDTKGDNMKELEEKHGKEKMEQAFFYEQASSTVGASWECRDCIVK